MGSPDQEVGKVLVYFILLPISIGMIIALIIYWRLHWGERLIIAKCGHHTKMKGAVFVGEVRVPIDLAEHGSRYLPEKCIRCIARETLGDVIT